MPTRVDDKGLKMMDNVLVVVRYAALRQSLYDWLAFLLPWCHLIAVANAGEAVAEARERVVRAIFVDTDDPGWSGEVALQQLRMALPEVPIIAVGFDDSGAHRMMTTQKGAAAYVSKSVLSAELPAVLRGLLEERNVIRSV